MKIIKDWNKIRYKIIGKIDLFFMNVKYGFLKTFLIFVFIVNQILFLFDFIKFFDNKHIFESTILNIYINLLIGTIIIAIIGYIIRYQYYSYIIQIKNYSQNQKLELKVRRPPLFYQGHYLIQHKFAKQLQEFHMGIKA